MPVNRDKHNNTRAHFKRARLKIKKYLGYLYITLRNSKIAPMEVSDKDWIIQSKLSYEDSMALKHMGRWALQIPRKDQNEFWKTARKLYKNDELGSCKYIMTSTAADTKNKNGVVMFFFEGSKNEAAIKEAGQMVIEKMNYKAPSGVNAIYFKSKTVGADKKYLYKIELPSEDSDSD